MSNQLKYRKGKVMKKLYTLMMMAMMGMMTMSLTSCEDEYIADTLEGTWEGNMYISSEWDGRVYDATRTEITFSIDPFRFTRGSGYWVDYYKNAPWGDYVANHIDWSVNNGVIYIYFREEGTSLEICDYRLDYTRFCGTIYDSGNRVEFSLYNTYRPNYDSYCWGWDYDSWGGYYWSRTRGADADSTINKTVEMPRRFVRNAK